MEPSTPVPQPTALQPQQPSTPVNQEPSQPSGLQLKKRNRKPLIIGIVIAAVVIVLGAASAFAYTMYQTPQKVVTDAVISLFTAEKLTHKGTLSMTTPTDAGETTMNLAFDGNISQDGVVTNGTLKVSQADKAAEVRVETIIGNDQAIYVKVNDVPTVITDYLTLFGGESVDAKQITETFSETIAVINGKWVKIDLSQSDEFKEVGTAQKCYQDLAKKLENDATLRNELKDAYTANQFISINKELGLKTINGTPSLGYEIGTDEAKTKAFFEDLNTSQLATELKKCDENIDLSYDTVKSETEGTTTNQIWASQFGHSLTRFESTYQNDEQRGSLVFEPKIGDSTPVTIPTDSVSTDAVIEAFRRDTEMLQTQMLQ